MKIKQSHIPDIEKALGIRLYTPQVNYLLEIDRMAGARRSGRTLAYCIILALSKGEPLDMRHPEEFSDSWGMTIIGKESYSRGYFRNMFLDIHTKLKNYGFPVRELKGLQEGVK